MKKKNESGKLKKPFFAGLLEQQVKEEKAAKVLGGAVLKGGYYTKPGSWDCILNEP
jgi:hypothetical protein